MRICLGVDGLIIKKEGKDRDTTFQIMFIAKLDFDDKTVDVLYSRRDGIVKAIKKDRMPELKNGMIVEVYDKTINDNEKINFNEVLSLMVKSFINLMVLIQQKTSMQTESLMQIII